jgi:alkanesulfonate monooxygenase SsuD/methylene tetrahydromethanopterin reductase-like flavin-dependent oxidoreductase (luciferase family)
MPPRHHPAGAPRALVSGTPDQVVGASRQVFAETSARGLLVETLSREEARLFAREVIPALQGISFISK